MSNADRPGLDAITARADANPSDVRAQIAAAFEHDRYGSEEDAIRYYDKAWALGIPPDIRSEFLVGYGSTLRNVGRLDESISIHRLGISEFPDFAPHHAFLALALHAADDHRAALAEALTALVDAGAENLGGYDRAIREYRDEFIPPN